MAGLVLLNRNGEFAQPCGGDSDPSGVWMSASRWWGVFWPASGVISEPPGEAERCWMRSRSPQRPVWQMTGFSRYVWVVFRTASSTPLCCLYSDLLLRGVNSLQLCHPRRVSGPSPCSLSLFLILFPDINATFSSSRVVFRAFVFQGLLLENIFIDLLRTIVLTEGDVVRHFFGGFLKAASLS